MDKEIFDKLINCLDRYYEARSEHDKAYEEYDGYSWDWVGESYIESLRAAKDDFRKTIDSYVDAKVEEKLRDELKKKAKGLKRRHI